jgi:hypothetical protein
MTFVTHDPASSPDSRTCFRPPITGVAKDVYPSLLGSLQYAAVLHASRCFHGVEHPWLRPSIPHGRTHAGSEKCTSIPPRHHRHAPDVGGAQTTFSNLHALPTLTGQTTTTPASRVRAISSLSDAGPLATSPSNGLVWPNPLVKPSTTLRLTPPRRDSTSANLWGRCSTPPSPKPPPYGRTTKAPSRTP